MHDQGFIVGVHERTAEKNLREESMGKRNRIGGTLSAPEATVGFKLPRGSRRNPFSLRRCEAHQVRRLEGTVLAPISARSPGLA
jgi:hypothetical protein